MTSPLSKSVLSAKFISHPARESKAAAADRELFPVRSLAWWQAALAYAVPLLGLFAVTRLAIPALDQWYDGPLVAVWFLCGGTLMAALLGAAVAGYWLERRQITFRGMAARFRVRALGWRDLLISLAMLLMCSLSSAAIVLGWTAAAAALPLVPAPSMTPSFGGMEPLSTGTLWLLAAWLPMFFFNIVGEELWWRGYLLPRHEASHGRWAWAVQGLGWTLFHLPFGLGITLVALPLLFGLPWLVQRTKNTSHGLLIHGLFNAAGFLAVASGAI